MGPKQVRSGAENVLATSLRGNNLRTASSSPCCLECTERGTEVLDLNKFAGKQLTCNIVASWLLFNIGGIKSEREQLTYNIVVSLARGISRRGNWKGNAISAREQFTFSCCHFFKSPSPCPVDIQEGKLKRAYQVCVRNNVRATLSSPIIWKIQKRESQGEWPGQRGNLALRHERCNERLCVGSDLRILIFRLAELSTSGISRGGTWI